MKQSITHIDFSSYVYRGLQVSSNRKVEHQVDLAGDVNFSCCTEYLTHVKNDRSAATWLKESSQRIPGGWLMGQPLTGQGSEGSTERFCFLVFLLEKLVHCLARGERCTSIPRNNNLPVCLLALPLEGGHFVKNRY